MISLLTPESSTLLTLALYAFAGVAGLLGMLVKNRTLRLAAASIATCGFILQTMILAMGFHVQVAGGLSIGAYLQLLAWFLMLCGIFLWVVLHQEIPLLFGSLLSILLFALSAKQLQMVVHVPNSLHAPFYALHVGTLYISLALIAISFVAGLFFLHFDKRLKAKKPLPKLFGDIPALHVLDSINSYATLAGFPLFTTGLLCGLYFAGPIHGNTVTGDPKEITSLVVWVFFAFLFYSRISRGWKGRKSARLMVAVFVLCLFSIVVVNLFMNSHHAFVRV